MKTKFYLILFLLLSAASYAQTRIVTGKVTDANTGEGLPGVNVTIKGTTQGTSTRIDGTFTLKVPRGAILVFSFVGMKTQEVEADKQTRFDIKMSETSLSEVVVTAVGITKEKKSLSYSVQTKIAGVEVNKASTKPKDAKTWKRSSGSVNKVRLEIGDEPDQTLPLHSRQIAVKVEGFRARVVMDCYFYNYHNKRYEGTFKLKLPNGASPAFFAFGGTKINFKNEQLAKAVDYSQGKQWNFDGDSLLANRSSGWTSVKRAKVVPKQKAAYAYTQTVDRQVDPALMEWAGADMFNCRVFPLMRKTMHHIVIAYDIDLLELDGNYVLQMDLGNDPLTISELTKHKKRIAKAMSQANNNRRGRRNRPRNINDDRFELKRAQLGLHVAVAQANQNSIAVLPATTPLQIGNNVHLKWHNPKAKELKITIPKQERLLLVSETKGDKNLRYFATAFKANLPKTPRKNLKQHAVFMLDVSLSSQPDKFNVWLATLRTFLRENRDIIKSFSVLCFNVEAFWWRKGWSRNTPRNVRRFMRFANKLSLEGATDLGRALDELYSSSLKNQAKYVFLLSDGDLSWGESGLYQLSKKIALQDQVYAFSTGFSGTDPRVLDHLTRHSQGAVFSILNQSEVQEVSKNFRYQPFRIEALKMAGCSDFLLAGRPQYLYPGQKVVLAGRYSQSKAKRLDMALSQGKQTHSLNINFSQQLASTLAPRVYGQIATTQLEELGSVAEKDAIKYATHFEVPGQTCSFVMLESERDYRQYNIKPENNLKFIKQNPVNQLLASLLKKTGTLGNPKTDFMHLVEKLSSKNTRNSGSKLKLPTALDSLIKALPEEIFQVYSPRLKGSRRTRASSSPQLLAALASEQPDYNVIMQAAEQRVKRNQGNAIRLLSSLVEKNAGNPNQLRDVGFMAMKWGLTEHTYFIFKKLIDLRPYQPPSYQLIAQALDQMGKYELAMLYYDIAIHTEWQDWESHDFKWIATLDYIHLLRRLSKKRNFKLKAYAKKRLKELEEWMDDEVYSSKTKDLMVYITWNTDETYVDLYVTEPSKEVCSYRNQETKSDGIMTEDVEGLGPVLYYIDKAKKGTYDIKINYYNEREQRASTKTRVYVVVYRNWGKLNESVSRKVVTLASQNANTSEDEGKKVRIGKVKIR
jgi:tetratricopeptide (TPR) repeat protein